MKNIKKLVYLFSLVSAVLVLPLSQVQAFPFIHPLTDDHHIRIVVPEENLEELKMVYPVGGEDITAYPQDKEVVSISINDDNLETLPVPFMAYVDGDDIILQLGDPAANSLNPVIGFHSTLEAAGMDKSPELVITAPGATAQVVYSTGNIEEVAFPDENFPMTLDATFRHFNLEGTLDIRFYVKAAAENPGDGDGDGDGDNGDDSNQDLGPQVGATGGCSLASSAGSPTHLGWMFGILLPVLATLRKKNR